MSPLQHAELGYAVAAVCLWGYALWVWFSSQIARRKQHNEVKS